MTVPKIDLEQILQLLQTNGSMTYNELSKVTGINYYTIRRYCQILIEQGRMEEVKPSRGEQVNLKEKRFRATGTAYNLEYPKVVWPDKNYMSVSRFPIMIVQEQNPAPELASGKAYREISKWFTLILNEAVHAIEGNEPNLRAVHSYRNNIEDAMEKLKEVMRLIDILLDQEVLKPGESFGRFERDATFRSEIDMIKKAVNIVVGEIVYPEVLEPKESEVPEV